MPRVRYYRKRPGYRAYIASLWSALHPFIEPASPSAAPPDTSGLRGLSSEQIDELRGLLGELGEQFRIGLNVGATASSSLPDPPPPGGDCAPNGFHHAKRPRALEKTIERSEDTRPSIDENDPVAAILKGVTHQQKAVSSSISRLPALVTGRDPDIQGCASVARCSQNASRVC